MKTLAENQEEHVAKNYLLRFGKRIVEKNNDGTSLIYLVDMRRLDFFHMLKRSHNTTLHMVELSNWFKPRYLLWFRRKEREAIITYYSTIESGSRLRAWLNIEPSYFPKIERSPLPRGFEFAC
ncbi:hypothetical protein MYX06_02315 [Patescibacteria group bacterium AH-259-L05]|nr:hypothetical protein [Patescibacteria group bacterium AH-259-L05]